MSPTSQHPSTMSTTRRWLVVALAAPAMVLAGCGDDAGGGGADGSESEDNGAY